MDTDDILGIDSPKESERTVLIKRELEKRSQDEVLVINPTNQEFEIIYNAIRYRVPSKDTDRGFGAGKIALSRYVAENYIDKMATKILFDQVSQAVEIENEKRAKNGQLPMNKWEEQPTFEARTGLLFNPDRLNAIRVSLYGGIYKKFGEDDMIMNTRKKEQVHSTDISKLMMDLDKKGAAPVNVSAERKPATNDDLIDSIQ